MTDTWALVLDEPTLIRLRAHLFPGDHDEHGAVLTAGIARTANGSVRLLVRDLHLAHDGSDYLPGKRGYRRLSPAFVSTHIRRCRDEQLAYLAVHNHFGRETVTFSQDDLNAHERGYPALLDIANGTPVGALVLNENALAGDIWTPDRTRRPIIKTTVIGHAIQQIYPSPPPRPPRADASYDRQSRLFGDRGQHLLGQLKVGIIGCGGVGMILVSQLARAGVGELLVIEPQRIEPSNLPRLAEATHLDAMTWLHRIGQHQLADRLSAPKLRRAHKIARRANPAIAFTGIAQNVIDADVAARLTDCDFIFLAADSHQARLVFNAIVHQYLIPGIQIGTKIPVDEDTGAIGPIHSNVRLVLPSTGCMRCNGLISPARLQKETVSKQELIAQRYIEEVPAASVITLNSLAASQAANDFLLIATGLLDPNASLSHLRFHPRERRLETIGPRQDDDCPDCGSTTGSRRARGDGATLPCRERPVKRAR